MKRRILITGADGFVGKYLHGELQKSGFEVLSHTIHDGDIASTSLDFDGVEHVFHLAALTFVPESWKTPKEFYRVNLMGTETVLEYCRKSGASMTFMSTYIYGQPQYQPVDENHPANPNSPYNHSKYLAEQLCRFYSDNFGVNVTVLRPFNIFGLGQSPMFLIPEIVEQVMNASKNAVHLKSLTPKRDYVYIDDVISALISTIENQSGFHVYNVASGKTHSVGQVVEAVMAVSGITKPVISDEVERMNEVTDISADINKISKELHWKPAFSLEEGLRVMISKWTN